MFKIIFYAVVILILSVASGAMIGCGSLLAKVASGQEINPLHALSYVGSYVLGFGGVGLGLCAVFAFVGLLVAPDDFE